MDVKVMVIVPQQRSRRAEQPLPDAPGVWPVSGHEGTGQQWRDRLVKQEVVLRVTGSQQRVGH